MKQRIYILLFTLASIIVRGYQYGMGNQIHYLTYLNYMVDPALYPRDYVLKTHTIPYTIYNDILRLLPTINGSREIPIFVMYVVLLYVFYLCIYQLVLKLFGSTQAAWIALVTLIFPLPIGGSTIFTLEKSLIPRFIADVSLVASVYLLTVRRNSWSALIAGCGFVIHPLTMLVYPLIVVVLTLTRYLTVRQMIQIAALFVIIPLPLLGNFAMHDVHQSMIFDREWKAVLHERIPYIFIHTWAIYDLVALAIVPVFFLAYNKLTRRKYSIHPVTTAVVISCYVLLVVSAVCDVFSIRLGLQLQLPRNVYLAIVFTLLHVSALISTRISRIRGGYIIAGIVIIIALLYLPSRLSDGILWSRPLTDFEQMALWSRTHTDRYAEFLVPPETTGFRFWSQRSVVNESKEGGDSIYDRAFAIEWDRREDLIDNHEDLTDSDIALLKDEFKINYIVTQKRLHKPLVHTSGNWRLYKI